MVSCLFNEVFWSFFSLEAIFITKRKINLFGKIAFIYMFYDVVVLQLEMFNIG